MLAVCLVEAVGHERAPRRATLRHEHLERREPIEHAGCDQLRDRALAAVGGLHVVHECTTATPEVHPGGPRRLERLGADVEADDGAGLRQRRPHRLPVVAVPVAILARRRDREERGLEPHPGGPLDLTDRVDHVEQRDHRGAHVPRRDVLILDRPVVHRLAAGPYEQRVLDRRGPDPERGIDDLTPDPLAVEVREPQVRVVRARRALVDGLAVLVDEVAPGHAPSVLLAVDVEGLMTAVLVAHAPRHARGEIGGQALREQVVRLECLLRQLERLFLQRQGVRLPTRLSVHQGETVHRV